MSGLGYIGIVGKLLRPVLFCLVTVLVPALAILCFVVFLDTRTDYTPRSLEPPINTHWCASISRRASAWRQ